MVSPTDPNEVRFTGENSFIRLFEKKDAPMTTRASHWRSLFSPGGQGHALFLKSDLTDDQVLVYSDNIALVRYLQEEIESLLFPEFGDQSLPVIDAIFTRSGRRQVLLDRDRRERRGHGPAYLVRLRRALRAADCCGPSHQAAGGL